MKKISSPIILFAALYAQAMAVSALMPPGIPASYNASILRPTGPAPTGQSTSIERSLNWAGGNNPEGNRVTYTSNNYIPKPFSTPYDRTAYYQGCLVFSNNNAYGLDGRNPRRNMNAGEDNAVLPNSLAPLHVLNMQCRDVARALPSLISHASGPNLPAGTSRPVVDPLLMTRYPEALLAHEIKQIANKSLNDQYANILLACTIIGVASTYTFAGVVVLQNNGAPPALGGQVNPALALNLANGNTVPYPMRNVWGNAAIQGAHLYILIKFVDVPGDELKTIAFIPYATTNLHVPDYDRVCDGWHTQETAHVIYVGICRDNYGVVRPGHVERAIGLDPHATIEEVNTAFNTLPVIDVYLDLGGHPKQVTDG